MYIVIVDFIIKPDQVEAFMPLIQANAAASVRDEPGCSRFDVVWDQTAPEAVFLYELYDDEAAFAAHLQSVHYLEFDAKTAAMITSKSVRKFNQICTNS